MPAETSDRSAGRESVLTATGYLMIKAGILFGRSFDGALESCGLTARQFLLMSVVAESRCESQLEVSRHMHLDPTLVVGLVDELEGRGLMTRRRHEEDRRRSVLGLTPAGTRLWRAASARAAAAEAEFMADLSRADRAAFRAALARIVVPKLDQL